MHPLFFAITLAFAPLETSDCFITFVQDGVIKQIKDEAPDEQFLLVLDALACSIAEEQKIPVNRVRVLPPGHGNTFVDRPATFHTLAPGVATSEKLPWPDFDIHQRRNKGLTPIVIHHMSRHRDLPPIVALDTFTGNADRSLPNIFHDEETDSFCGIDMAAAFNRVLAALACDQIQNLAILSEKEREALFVYQQTLCSLIQNYPVKKLHCMLDEFAKEAGFTPGSPLFTQEVQERIYYHKRIMKENYQQCEKLTEVLRLQGLPAQAAPTAKDTPI